MTEAEIGESLALERGDTAALQSALNVSVGANLVTDGWLGSRTRSALILFQEREGLPETGKLDPETCERLGIDVGAYVEEAA
jgi:peptidoglycan hydrolase-like protein with peptidoglycan-binding domain